MIADAANQGLPIEEPELDAQGQMSFLEHLDELRRRVNAADGPHGQYNAFYLV